MSPYRRSAKQAERPEEPRAGAAFVVVALAITMTVWWLRPAEGPSVRSGGMALQPVSQTIASHARR